MDESLASPQPHQVGGVENLAPGKGGWEDKVLYGFVIGVTLVLSLYLWTLGGLTGKEVEQKSLTEKVLEMDSVINGLYPERLLYYAGKSDINASYMGYALHLLEGERARRNAAFLIGSIVALVGCLVVVRGVRDAKFEGSLESRGLGRAALATSSPGLAMAMMGCVIIILTLVIRGRVSFAASDLAPTVNAVSVEDGFEPIPASTLQAEQKERDILRAEAELSEPSK